MNGIKKNAFTIQRPTPLIQWIQGYLPFQREGQEMSSISWNQVFAKAELWAGELQREERLDMGESNIIKLSEKRVWQIKKIGSLMWNQ